MDRKEKETHLLREVKDCRVLHYNSRGSVGLIMEKEDVKGVDVQ